MASSMAERDIFLEIQNEEAPKFKFVPVCEESKHHFKELNNECSKQAKEKHWVAWAPLDKKKPGNEGFVLYWDVGEIHDVSSSLTGRFYNGPPLNETS